MLRREKEELNRNHELVMSERDHVHKEIDMLSEKLAASNAKVLSLRHYLLHQRLICHTSACGHG